MRFLANNMRNNGGYSTHWFHTNIDRIKIVVGLLLSKLLILVKMIYCFNSKVKISIIIILSDRINWILLTHAYYLYLDNINIMWVVIVVLSNSVFIVNLKKIWFKTGYWLLTVSIIIYSFESAWKFSNTQHNTLAILIWGSLCHKTVYSGSRVQG